MTAQQARRVILRLTLATLLPAAGVRAQPAKALRISGTGSGTGTMQLLAAAFMKEHPGSVIEVLPALGSSGGIAALLDGRLDLALSNRAANDKELARAPLRSTEYARTPFVVAVGAGVKARALSSAQLAALFAEGAAQYPDGQRARPVMRLADATDTALLKSIAPEVAAAVDAASQRRGMIDAATDSAAADLIEKTPGAFGASTLALMLSENRALAALSLNGVEPTVKNLDAGHWRLAKSLYLIQPPQPTPLAQRFVAWLQSPEARRILSQTGHSLR